MKRAEKAGTTSYRGHELRIGPQYPVLDTHVRKSAPEKTRLHILTWNCSGLSSELLLEIFTFLRTRPEVQVIALQETHWTGAREWHQEGWHLMHSAAEKGRQAGVLLGVRADVTQPSEITWAETIPGRVLHWCGCVGKQQLGIVNLYQ